MSRVVRERVCVFCSPGKLGYFFLIVPALAVAMPADAAPEPGGLVDETAPWVRYPDSDLRGSPTQELLADISEDERPEGFWHGDMYFDAESGAASLLDEMGLPTPRGVQHDETPGVVYLNFGGVTLTSGCTNSARNCTGLVAGAGGQVTFPSYGNSSTRAAIVNAFQADYQPMDLVVVTDRPPDYLPYVMNVIGGTNANAGQDPGACGVAYVACDGAKRNHVSLTFPLSCGQVPVVVSHETAHNWGLEHVTDSTDMMYPTVGSNREFRDRCMGITTVDDNPIQCGYIHEAYCAAGSGSEQNSFSELLGVFGPRTPDAIAPEIVSMVPADGSEFTSDDSFTISASVEENSNFVGARWTWTQGDPSGNNRTRCTNDVCDQDYGAFLDPNETNWDFLTLGPGVPEGTYAFEFEVMDAYGNSDTDSITITVQESGGTGTSDSGGTTGGTGTNDSGGTTGGTGTSDSGSTGSGAGTGTGSGDQTSSSDVTSSSDTGNGSTPSSGSSSSSGYPGGEPGDDKKGCICTTSPTSWKEAAFGLVVLLVLRRRESPSA